MTVSELKEAIKDLPDHLEVFIDERQTDFRFGLLNTVRQVKIDFYEDSGDDIAIEKGVPAVILTEE